MYVGLFEQLVNFHALPIFLWCVKTPKFYLNYNI